MVSRVAIWGASGHAKVVADAIRSTGKMEIVGFIDDVASGRRGEAFCGASILGGRDVLAALRKDDVGLMLAVGLNTARLSIAHDMTALGFQFPPVIHPNALVSTQCRVGPGVYVGPGCVLNADAHIGAHAIINTAAVVEHDCMIGEGVHLSPMSCLAGRVVVGRGAWIGAGAVVRDGTVIGAGSTIGMGSMVRTDIPAGVVAYGNPARVIRKIGEDSK